MRFSPDNKTIAIRSMATGVELFDGDRGVLLDKFDDLVNLGPSTIAFGAEGRLLAMAQGAAIRVVRVSRSHDGTTVADKLGPIHRLAVSPMSGSSPRAATTGRSRCGTPGRAGCSRPPPGTGSPSSAWRSCPGRAACGWSRPAAMARSGPGTPRPEARHFACWAKGTGPSTRWRSGAAAGRSPREARTRRSHLGPGFGTARALADRPRRPGLGPRLRPDRRGPRLGRDQPLGPGLVRLVGGSAPGPARPRVPDRLPRLQPRRPAPGGGRRRQRQGWRGAGLGRIERQGPHHDRLPARRRTRRASARTAGGSRPAVSIPWSRSGTSPVESRRSPCKGIATASRP